MYILYLRFIKYLNVDILLISCDIEIVLYPCNILKIIKNYYVYINYVV